MNICIPNLPPCLSAQRLFLNLSEEAFLRFINSGSLPAISLEANNSRLLIWTKILHEIHNSLQEDHTIEKLFQRTVTYCRESSAVPCVESLTTHILLHRVEGLQEKD